jgi:predicted RNA binding protein YcfA (HicA-like mRNA interferase family)
MRKSITFAKLDRFLADLGFVVTVVPHSHTLYEHAESGTVLLLRLHRPNDAVSPGTMTIVRKFVVDNGLAEPEAFERLSQKTSA